MLSKYVGKLNNNNSNNCIVNNFGVKSFSVR